MRLFQNSHFLFRKFSRKFLKIFFMSPKGPSFNVFDILQQTGFEKVERPPFTILKTLRLLSLRYSADFRRSRLVCTGM